MYIDAIFFNKNKHENNLSQLMMSSLNSQNRRGLKDTYKKIIEYVSNYRPELGQ